MEDKEIGALWLQAQECQQGTPPRPCWHCEHKIDLIHKLVEERVNRKCENLGSGLRWMTTDLRERLFRDTLDEFGIDFKTWQ